MKPFLLQTQLNLVTERVIQDTAIYICAMSCVPVLNSGFCRTLLFKHKPNNFGEVNQTTIFYFWQGTIHKTKQTKTTKNSYNSDSGKSSHVKLQYGKCSEKY